MVKSATKDPTPCLVIEQVSIDDLTLDPANPRHIGEAEPEALINGRGLPTSGVPGAALRVAVFPRLPPIGPGRGPLRQTLDDKNTKQTLREIKMNPQAKNPPIGETDGNLGPKQRKLARVIAQRLAVERASRRFEVDCASYDYEVMTELYPYHKQACCEDLCLSGEQLSLLRTAAGWPSGWPDRTRLDLMKRWVNLPIRQMLRLELGADLSDRHEVIPGPPCPALDPTSFLSLRHCKVSELSPSYAPITVLIGEGTSQEEAVALLELLLTEVRDNYEEILLSSEAEAWPAPTLAEAQGLAPGTQGLAVQESTEGIWRSDWWEGGPLLTKEQARALAHWLEEQAARVEAYVADPQVARDDLPF
jgi:hypothetical protein